MTIKENYETLLVEIRKEFPDFHIIKKEDSRLMKLIDVYFIWSNENIHD